MLRQTKNDVNDSKVAITLKKLSSFYTIFLDSFKSVKFFAVIPKPVGSNLGYGTTVSSRDYVTMFSGPTIVRYYYILSIFVVATPVRHRDFEN